ncbi:hypothetical protein [Microbacterium sp.]|uniref:hypothetical protein n=1 Tax=Microbacterium sp. TaxID=51671 RepID=UPI00333F19DB
MSIRISKTGKIAATVALTVGLVAAPVAANAAWVNKAWGPYTGMLACFGDTMRAEQSGHVLLAPCHMESDGKVYFYTKYWK